MQNNKYLGKEKVGKLLLKFSVPCILSLLVSALYNIVDQVFIGNSELGFIGNAATGVVFPLTIVSMAFAWCFGDGVAAFMSIRQGQKNTKDIHNAVGTSIIASFVVGVVFALICFLLAQNLLFAFGASDASIELAKNYFYIILVATPLCMVMNTMTAVIRADGKPNFSMLVTLSGAIINVILDPIFIFVFKWGIEGAALATIMGQIISFFIASAYFIKPKTFRLTLKSFIPNFRLLGSFTKMGISTFITQMSIVVISLACNAMLAKYGAQSIYGQDIPIAVFSIAMKVFTIVINIVVGLIVGAQPILGFNFGAGNYDRVRQTFKLVLKLVVVVGLVATVLFEFCPQIIINIFGSGDDLYYEFAELTFRIFLALVLFTCANKVTSIFFQAVGKPTKAAFISLVRDIICFVPLVIILPSFMGVTGVLWAAPIADIIGITVSVILVLKFFRTLGKTSVAESAKTVVRHSREGVIVAISRQHGSAGKYIGELVAKRLKIPYYYKELVAIAAEESGLSKEYIGNIDEENPNALYSLYLSSTPVEYAIEAQEKAIKEVASQGSCVIVGRAADYILRNNKNILRVFIYAPDDYRVEKLKEMYGDTKVQAKKSIKKSDHNRSRYYESISGLKWGDRENYDLLVDSSIGNEATAKIIADYADNFSAKRR
ncbi:MAG: MATE family efflux transporter [Candidatus Nomurabacteria bacterium]|jgi:putative MATE family efflux protein|nr:MATE family efflux transporter [Candidatus Nomurabacteria bacterium]